MKIPSLLSSLAFAAVAMAGGSMPSICDKYTTALLKQNTAANQQTLLTLVVNTAVIGNYTKPNVGIKVAGILAPGTGTYAGVNLLPYFNGMLLSTNPRNGSNHGISVNFLDSGGAAPLKMNKPANSDKSAQFILMTHLYKYFAYLLGCSKYGNTTMAYDGSTSMWQVHKFMDLGPKQVGWFIEQVGLSAASFGVSSADVQTVATALNKSFAYRCEPPASIPAYAPPDLQSICIKPTCPLAPNPACPLYSYY